MVGSDSRAMSATFTISTDGIDRDGDIMKPSGCRLEGYRKNPVVLWDHQSDKAPLGIAEKDGQLLVTIAADRVISTCQFHGKTRESTEAFELVDGGIVRAASVGFMPVKHRKSGDGYIFDEWELTEWSITPLGANAGALRLHLDKGRVKSMSLRKKLEPFAAKASKSWSHGVTLEKAMKDDELDDELEDTPEEPVDDIEKTDDEPEEEIEAMPEEAILDETPDDDEPTDELTEETSIKPGARALGMICAAFDMLCEQLTSLLGDNEHPEVVTKLTSLLEHCQTVSQEAKDDLAKLYPDVDPESVMPSAEEPPADVPAEPLPEDDEPLDELQVKRLSKASKACVKDAAEFLDDLGNEATVPSRLKGGCRYHAKALGDMMTGLDKPAEGEDEPDDMEEKAILALAKKTAKWRIAK